MSRVRTRPTRDNTCEKLFEAAARVFEQQGIGNASIEAIAAAAGFTRGAFYSNFKSKDELIIAMLEDHVDEGHPVLRPGVHRGVRLGEHRDGRHALRRELLADQLPDVGAGRGQRRVQRGTHPGDVDQHGRR